MSKKKRTAKKLLTESILMLKSKSYIQLTKEQFEKIDDFINWNNSVSELDKIKTYDSDVSNVEIAFFVGGVHNKLESEFEEISKLLNELKPDDSDDETSDDNEDN